MRLSSTLGLGLAASSLALTTGCGFSAGLLFGMLGGDTPVGVGPMEPMMGGHGTSVVCFGSDADVSDAALAEGLFRIDGEVVASNTEAPADFDNLVPCWTQPAQTLSVVDADGNTWTVGYAWLDSAGWEMTPWISVGERDQVELILRADTSAGSEAAGMAVVKDSDVVYVLESGRNGRGLRDGDVPGLSFGKGDEVGRTASDCGDKVSTAQKFESGDSILTMYPGEDTGFELSGEYITTCSIDSWELEDDCGEDILLSESSFVMFR